MFVLSFQDDLFGDKRHPVVDARDTQFSDEDESESDDDASDDANDEESVPEAGASAHATKPAGAFASELASKLGLPSPQAAQNVNATSGL